MNIRKIALLHFQFILTSGRHLTLFFITYCCLNFQFLASVLVYYQKIKSDKVLLEKMINKRAEVESEIQNSSFNTISSTLRLFRVPITQKFWSEDNFFVGANRCANDQLKLDVIKLDMPLGIFRTKVHIFLVESLLILTLISLVLIL